MVIIEVKYFLFGKKEESAEWENLIERKSSLTIFRASKFGVTLSIENENNCTG